MRSVNTRFWDDPFIQDLSPNDKLLFIYLLTNPLTNLIGIYEISLKRIMFDTGLSERMIRNGFERFGNHSKAFYTKDNFVVLPNWLKNQRFNRNMIVAAKKEFNALPNSLKDNLKTNGSEWLTNGFEWLPNGSEWFGENEKEYEKEIESEKESEGEKETRKKFIPPTLEEVILYFTENGYTEEAARKAFNYYSLADWHDSQGHKIKNWKQKMVAVWFKQENKVIERRLVDGYY